MAMMPRRDIYVPAADRAGGKDKTSNAVDSLVAHRHDLGDFDLVKEVHGGAVQNIADSRAIRILPEGVQDVGDDRPRYNQRESVGQDIPELNLALFGKGPAAHGHPGAEAMRRVSTAERA